MDVIKRIDSYLNESTTLSNIGVNQKQIKAVYGERGIWSGVVPDAKAKYEKTTSKRATTDLMKSNDSFSPVVVGISTIKPYEGNLFVAIAMTNGSISVRQYDEDGRMVNSWDVNSPARALYYFKGVKEYYIAKNGAVVKKGEEDLYFNKEKDKTEIAYKIANVIGKEAEKMFMDVRSQLANKISADLKSGDFIAAYKKLKNVITNTNWDVREKELKEIAFGGSWTAKNWAEWLAEIINGGSPGTFGYYPAIRDILVTSSEKEYRKAGAEMLRQIKKRLNDFLKEID